MLINIIQTTIPCTIFLSNNFMLFEVYKLQCSALGELIVTNQEMSLSFVANSGTVFLIKFYNQPYISRQFC